MKSKLQQKRGPVPAQNKPAAGSQLDLKGWKSYVPLGITLGITFFLYLPILNNGFVWDDETYILNNELIRKLSWNGIAAIFSNFSNDNYAPITDLINAFQYRTSGLSPSAFHLGSLAFHLLNITLVFISLRMLSGRLDVAVVGSLWFAVHPLQVESVAWASGGSTLYFSAFFLGSLISYLFYLNKHRKIHLFISILFFILSLLSKAVAVTLPLVLLIIDYYRNRKLNLKSLVDKVPFLVLAVAIGILTIFLKNREGGMSNTELFSFPERIVFACYGLVSYLLKLIIPYQLSAFYPYPVRGIPVHYYLYVLAVAGLVIGIIFSARSSKKILFSIGFFAITIFPLLQLIPVGGAIMADRYVYLSSVGIFFLAGSLLSSLWMKKLKWVAMVIFMAFSIFYSVKTYHRSAVWKTDISLWTDVIGHYKTARVAYYNRGLFLMDANRNKEALEDFNKAIELRPDIANAYYCRGNLFMREGRNADALRDYSKAIELQPGYAEAYNNRGNVLKNEGRNDEALNDYNRALELKPDYAEAFNNRGTLQKNEKRYDAALEDFNQAIQLKPDFADAYNNRAIVFFQLNKYEDAIEDYSRSLELNPGNAQVYYNRAVAKLMFGKQESACEDLKQSVSLGFQQANEALARFCP